MPNMPEPTNKTQSTVNTPVNPSIAADDMTRITQTAQKMGYSPRSQQELDMFARMAFTPEELKAKGLDKEYQGMKEQAAGASQAMDAWKPTNSGLFALQQALNMKQNVTNQPLGTSDLYKKAGVDSYATLRQSMDERQREMGRKYDSFKLTVGQAATGMADLYNAASETYGRLRDEIDVQDQRTYELLDAAAEQERLMQQMETQHKYEMEMEGYLSELEQKYKGSSGTGASASDFTGGIDQGVYDEGKQSLNDIFGLGRAVGWCGVYSSSLSTATQVGDSWSSKKSHIDKRNNPSAGDKLLVPLGVSDGKGYGHVATVLSYNPNSGDILVIESNRDGRQNKGKGKGVNTIGVYNLTDLQNTYGGNFGFASGELKSKYQSAIPIAEKMIGGKGIETYAQAPDQYQPQGSELRKNLESLPQKEQDYYKKAIDITPYYSGLKETSNYAIQTAVDYAAKLYAKKIGEAPKKTDSQKIEDIQNYVNSKYPDWNATQKNSLVKQLITEAGIGETKSSGLDSLAAKLGI